MARIHADQKEALLKFMEKHSDFAKGRVSAMQGAKVNESLWERLKNELNDMPGASKNIKGWKDTWSVMRSAAKQAACSNGKPKNIPTGGGAPDEDDYKDDCETDQGFTSDDPFVDRIMNLLGWHLAFGVEVDDELESYFDGFETPASSSQSLQSSVAITFTPKTIATSSSEVRTQQATFSYDFNELKQLVERQSFAIAQLKSLFQQFM